MKVTGKWFRTSARLPVALVSAMLIGVFALVGSLPAGRNMPFTSVARADDSCLNLIKTIDGPYRTADVDLGEFDATKLGDKIIPVGVKFLLNGGQENLFFLQVDIRVENCGSTDLTSVTVSDSFDKQVQPFETNDSANIDLTWEIFDASNPFTREYIVWTPGTIPAGESRTLKIKVGTEFNRNQKLEPAQANQTFYYNGRSGNGQWVNSASVTTDQGLSAAVGRMQVSFGAQVSCAGTDGYWNQLLDVTQQGPRPHNKCAPITTSLPIELTATAP